MTFAVIQYAPDAELTAISMSAQSAMMAAASQFARAKEDCIKAILRQVLRREPIFEDAKRLTLVRHPIMIGDPFISSVYFDGVYLGIITETMSEIKFTPEK